MGEQLAQVGTDIEQYVSNIWLLALTVLIRYLIKFCRNKGLLFRYQTSHDTNI